MATEHIDSYISPVSWSDKGMNWSSASAQEASYPDALYRACLERAAITAQTVPAITIPNPDRKLTIDVLVDVYFSVGFLIVQFINPNKPQDQILGIYQNWTLSEAMDAIVTSDKVYPYPQEYFRDNSNFMSVAKQVLDLMVCTQSDISSFYTGTLTISNDRDWINPQGPDYVGWGRGGFDGSPNNLAVNLSVTGVMLEGTPNSCAIRVWNGVGPDPGYTDARTGFSVTVPPGYTLDGTMDSTNLPIGNIIQQTYSPSGGPTGWQSTWIVTGGGGAHTDTSSSGAPTGNSDGTTFTGHASTLVIDASASYPPLYAPLTFDVQLYISGSGPSGFTVPGYGWSLNTWNTIATVVIDPSTGSPQDLTYTMDIQPVDDTSSVYDWSVGGARFVPDVATWASTNPHLFRFHP